VAVQVLPGPVVTHGGARIGVAGGDLDVPQIDTSIEHGRDEGMTKHMRVGPDDLDPRRAGELVQAAGSGVPVHPGAAAVGQDRPSRP
jgi:hypothetical protein